MRYIKGNPRNQMTMVTECLEDYISEENPVRVIDAFADSLDLDPASFIRTTPKETGRPPCDPRMDKNDETDPEARRMHSKDGFHCCCNVQTAIDKGSHLIAEYEVTNHNTDQGLLKDVAQNVKNALEIEDLKNSTKPENTQKCIREGVLPACYENTAIDIELQEQSEVSCFLLNEDGTVTCSMGNILSKTKKATAEPGA